MSEASTNATQHPIVVRVKRKAGGRPFKRGNTFGKGNPLAGAIAELRAVVVRHLSKRKCKELLRELDTLAFMVPADAAEMAVKLAAIKELFNRAIGKADATLNVVHSEKKPVTFAEAIEKFEQLNVPESRWPPMLLAYRDQKRKSA